MSSRQSAPARAAGRDARRSRQVLWAALALALALGAMVGTFLSFERRAEAEDHQRQVDLYARMLDETTQTVLSSAESVLMGLQPAVEGTTAGAPPDRINTLLAAALPGRPYLRSLAVVDAGDRVLASSNESDIGVALPPDWAAAAVAGGAASRILPLARIRDLADLGARRADIQAVAWPLVLPAAGGRLRMVALLNSDHLATLYERTLDGTRRQAALVDLQKRVVVASASLDLAPGSDLGRLPLLRNMPERETGHGEQPAGMAGQPVVASFRTLRRWPAAVVVEEPLDILASEGAELTRWALLFLFTGWALLGAGTLLLRRSLLRDEALSQDLRAAVEEQRLARRELAESEARARATFEQAAVGFLQEDLSGRLQRVNRTLCRLLGYRPEELLPLSLQELVHPDDLAGELEGTAQLRDGRRPSFAREQRYRRQDGNWIWLRVTASLLRGADGEPVAVVAVVEDISARRRAESQVSGARQAELEIAERIQRDLLVTTLPTDLPGLQVASHNMAFQGVDGDFIEVVRLAPHLVDVVAGDVMGKGLSAALIGAATKLQLSRSITELLGSQALLASPLQLPRPADIVKALNRAMTPTLLALEAFVTLCYLRIDSREGTVTWVGCGHEETLVLGRDGALRTLANQHPPLGVMAGDAVAEDLLRLDEGDWLFLCSDGVSDAVDRSGERVGRARVGQALRRRGRLHDSPVAVLHGLRRDVLEGAVLHDDVTMMVLHRDSSSTARRAVPIALSSLRELRTFAEACLARSGLAERDRAALLLGLVEAFTNVVRHATGLLEGAPAEVAVRADAAAIVVELVYFGDRYVPPSGFGDTDFGLYPEGGFGLQIIERASDRLRYLHEHGVNTVRMLKHR